jgi:hypothetical protein
MKKFLLVFYVLLTFKTYSQTNRKIFQSFLSNDDKFIIENLVLSTDHIFFSFASCECGKEYYGKGTWQIKGNRLYLFGFDSAKAIPRAKIRFTKKQITDSVTIIAFDYFGNPMRSFLLGLVYNDSLNKLSQEFVNGNGKLTVSKKDYSGFYLLHEMWAPDLYNNNYHFFDAETTDISIRFDFASAGFDRKPIPFSYKERVFIIRNGNLYSQENKLIFRRQ